MFRDWLNKKTPTPPSQPIKSKTKTNRDLLAHVFPRLTPGTCISFASSDWLLFTPVVIGRNNYFVFVLQHSIENRPVDSIYLLHADEDRLRSNSAGGRILLKNQHGDVLTAKYVIITVPLTVLKDGDITFVPVLSAEKSRAINTIQMLGAWKIVCRFKHRFWPEKLHQVYIVHGFASEMWTCSRDSPDSDDKCHVIVGFETAESADRKSVLSGQEVLEGFLSHLDEIFGYENILALLCCSE